MDNKKIIALRLERQRILSPMDIDEYDSLFRFMSPVQTRYWTAPGEAPSLPERAEFDDIEHNAARRARRQILKGRFQNGNVAYVDYNDVELYACAYRSENTNTGFEELKMLELLRQEGPLNIGSIKEITGMLVKRITPILHKLQKQFLAYEDQIDNEGDRAWYVLESEFPEIDLNKYGKIEAIAEIIQRYLHMYVFAAPEEIRSYYHFTVKDISAACNVLMNKGIIIHETCGNKKGYILAEDSEKISNYEKPVPSFVLLLNRNDFLAKSCEYANKVKFAAKDDFNILNYIMIDGRIRGALTGKFKFGPFVLEDVVLDLPEDESDMRKDEIIQAIYKVYDKDLSPLKNYSGMV